MSWNMIRPGAAGPCPLDGVEHSTCTSPYGTTAGQNPVDIPPERAKTAGPLRLYAVVFNGVTSMMWLSDRDAALIGVEVPGA